MKVYYFNDETAPVTVDVNHKSMMNEYGIYKFKMEEKIVLQPRQGQVFEIDAPVGSIPFVKKWDHRVMITYIDPDKANIT